MYVWTQASGIGAHGGEFNVSPLAAGISGFGLILAALAYFVVPDDFKSGTTYAAYWVLLFAIAGLELTTGTVNSPFIAIWMATTIFAGLFGRATLAILFLGLNGFWAFAILNGHISDTTFLNLALGGELPIVVSFILWHGKSTTEKTKERAYHDLANELNQESGKAEAVIGAISDGVIAVNKTGLIELINPAATKIVGWGNQDALTLDYKSVLHLVGKDGGELEKARDPVYEVLNTYQTVRRNDLQLQTNSGKKINIEVVVSPVAGMGSGAIIVFRDVTKEQEEERAQAEFISTASHEMRTPVASIEGYLGLALNPATAKIDDKARDFITKAHEAAQHLGRLFQDLLDVTKADDGRLSNNPKVINLVEFTSDIVGGLQQKAKDKNLEMFFKPTTAEAGGQRTLEPVYYVNLDGDHLREVIANLVENAIKYTPKGQVLIDIRGDDEHVVVSITDSGIGIPREDIPHLFQKFYRVDNTDTREIGGTGLGLYLCRRLVEAMSGRIWVDSEYKKGSTFSVELPRISHDEATRMIEATDKSQPPTAADAPMPALTEGEEQGEMTPREKDQALATPIIMNRTEAFESAKAAFKAAAAAAAPATPKPAVTPAVAAAAPPPTTVDPLVGKDVAKPEALRPRNPMVLPPNLQAVKSTLQTAPKPTAPAAAVVAPKPVAKPAVAPPAAPATAPPVTAPPIAPPPLPKPSISPQSLQTIEPTTQPRPQTPPVNATPRPISVPERKTNT